MVSPQAPPSCTTSKVPVYVDGAVSAGAVATSLFVGLAALGNSDKREQLGYATLFTFLASIPFGVSGIVGGVRVNACRRAQATYRSLQTPMYPGYPAPFPPPPAPQNWPRSDIE